MIEQVIKRNGQVQEFDPAKLNGWGIWASDNLGSHVDWISAVLHVVSTSPSQVTTKELQNTLIKYCLSKPSWDYNRMAGRLYISQLYKELYDDRIPTIKQCFKRLVEAGMMTKEFFNSFTSPDYKALEEIIDHSRDLDVAHYQIKQSMEKYSLKDRVDDIYYETPQFSMMRVAMRMCQNKGKGKARIARIKRHYDAYSRDHVNVPTPYYTNAGTSNSGFLSCCLHTNDDTLLSLAASNHISYMMTAASAGIGQKSYTRAAKDKVRGGLIQHMGRINYNRVEVAMINANMQNGRGGSEAQFFDCIDIEALQIIPMKNPMTAPAKQVRGLDYGFCYNEFFVSKAALNLDYHLFSYKDHPELFMGLATMSFDEYEKAYEKALSGNNRRIKVNARDFLVEVLEQSVEVGQMYTVDLSLMNGPGTPFKEPILQSNLCTEIRLVTKPYKHIMELYKDHYDEGDGEVAVCAIAGVSVGKCETEMDYKEAAWVALDMIHTAIHETSYPFPQVAFTAKQRMNAGVGVVDLAHLMAKNNKNFYDQEGRNFIHKVMERHYYYLLEASIELAEEFGNAPWMHKTKWPDGWLPFDNYKKSLDEVCDEPLHYDWESKRKIVIERGGHAFSTLAANMPAESSSIKSGTSNGAYPIRDLDLKKGNDQDTFDFVVPESDLYREAYLRNIAWDIDVEHIAMKYGIIQKFTDQTTSADIWYKLQGATKIPSHDLLRGFFAFCKYGVPTRYYLNTLTGKGQSLNDNKVIVQSTEYVPEAGECEGCKM